MDTEAQLAREAQEIVTAQLIPEVELSLELRSLHDKLQVASTKYQQVIWWPCFDSSQCVIFLNLGG